VNVLVQREVCELRDRLKVAGVIVTIVGNQLAVTGSTQDPFLLAGIETLRGREDAVRHALRLGPGWREALIEERDAETMRRKATASTRKPSCRNGHAFTDSNTIFEKAGPNIRRRCRRCMAARRRAA